MINRLIFFALLICSQALMAQQQAPKGADKILAKNNKSATDNFTNLKILFAEKGIEIVSQDPDIKQFKTAEMALNKSGAKIYYVVFCKDNSIQLTGFFNTGIIVKTGSALVVQGDPFRPIVNRGMKGSMFAEAWKAMNELALSLGEEVEYLGGNEKKS